MYCTFLAPATAVFASAGSISPLVEAPELNEALQSLSAQPQGAEGLRDKLDRLQAALRAHSDRIGPPGDRYCQQLSAEDPVQVAEALHRLAFDADTLVILRDSEGFNLPIELASEVPKLDRATLRELEAGLARAVSPDQPERLLNKDWFRMATNLGSGLFYMVPCLLEWAAQVMQAKMEPRSNGLSRLVAGAARLVKRERRRFRAIWEMTN